jgi:predicted RNA binding protein YcfA (HicA-like mRNA interferase family)
VAKLPTDLSGSQVGKALQRAGFVFQRQKGSHMVFRRDTPHARVVVPDHRTIGPFGRALCAASSPMPA